MAALTEQPDGQSVIDGTYFGSKRFSDIKIRLINGDVLFAHKVLLAQGSGYFHNALDPEHKNAINDKVRMGITNPLAARGLIAHLYGLRFDGQHKAVPNANGWNLIDAMTGKDVLGTSEYAIYLIDLAPAASQYQVPDLKRTALGRVGILLQCIARKEETNDEMYTDDLARHIYLKQPTVARDLRKDIVLVFVKRVARLTQ